ncbi:MAG: helix-turn-helix domain-containing protein [Vicinamibacterales bacterium]
MKRQKRAAPRARVRADDRDGAETGPGDVSGGMRLSEMRKAQGLTQQAMADLLGVSQAEVSKMERRGELRIGTVRKYIEAIKGELVLAARFPDGSEIPIKLAETDAGV